MPEAFARVLLVDDDEDEYVVTRDLFAELEGFALSWVQSYDAALREMRSAAYAAHLVDYHLGARTGVELLREARELGVRTPILILTGAGDRAVDLEAMEAGAADFLDKSQLTAALLERSLRYAIERRRNEEKLERSDELVRTLRETEARLNGALHARDEFLSIASHELKTPLTPLRLQLDQLAKTIRDPAALQMVDIARRQTLRMRDLADALLDVSRVSESGIPLRAQELDLAALARDAVERFRPLAEAARSPLLFVAPAGVHGVWDASRLEQVLSNLLSNALKYGRGQPITVRVEERGGEALLSVRDEGIGISSEDMARIFGRFERGVSVRHYGGLGLGLYIAREIVQAHGGFIRVESEHGRGSTFTVVLPVHRPDAQAALH